MVWSIILGAARPDIIHPAADEEGEHLFDVKPEVVPELFEVHLILMKKLLPITGLATPEVCHLKQLQSWRRSPWENSNFWPTLQKRAPAEFV